MEIVTGFVYHRAYEAEAPYTVMASKAVLDKIFRRFGAGVGGLLMGLICAMPACARESCMVLRGIPKGAVFATWYGGEHRGQPMATGEPFDETKMTAAYGGAPFNTLLRVTNIMNGRTVDVQVKDRSGMSRRHIDLSEAAAVQIGMARCGTAPVRLAFVHPSKKRVLHHAVSRHPAAAKPAAARPKVARHAALRKAKHQRPRKHARPVKHMRHLSHRR